MSFDGSGEVELFGWSLMIRMIGMFFDGIRLFGCFWMEFDYSNDGISIDERIC